MERLNPVGVTKDVYPEMAAQECIKLADMIALALGQKETDVLDQLTNEDFVGDFFAIGDTVQVVAIDPNSIKVVKSGKDDVRPTLDKVAFSMRTMTIDSEYKYGFQIKDLERLEDRWNHEAAAHALAARQMRRANGLDVLELITTTDTIATLGTPASPINLTVNGTTPLTPMEQGNKIFRLVNAMKEYLRTKGVIDGDAYNFGANKTVPLRGTVSLFVAPTVHNTLLNCQYVREDDVTEDVIRNGKYEKFAGCLLNSAPALDVTYGEHVSVLNGAEANAILIMGTKNLVTRATKVLPPEKMRDYVHFADNYYGREIYGQVIATPEAGIVAFVKVADEFLDRSTFLHDPADKGLFPTENIQNPFEANNAAGRFLPNEGYANAPAGTYVTPTQLETTLAGYATDDELTTGLAGKVAQTDYNNHVHSGVTAGETNTGRPVAQTPEPGDTDSDSDTDTDTDNDPTND